MSGGGETGRMYRAGWMRTPVASPASSVPSGARYETWWLAWPGVGNASKPSTSLSATRTFCSGTAVSSPQSGSKRSP
jgi:hypothetical protein